MNDNKRDRKIKINVRKKLFRKRGGGEKNYFAKKI